MHRNFFVIYVFILYFIFIQTKLVPNAISYFLHFFESRKFINKFFVKVYKQIFFVIGNHVGGASVDLKTDYAHYFTMDNRGTKLLTKQSLKNLVGGSISFDLILKSPLSDGTVLERVETLTVEIVADEYFVEFPPSTVHSGTVDERASANFPVKNLDKIQLVSGKLIENLRFTIADDDGTSLFKVITVTVLNNEEESSSKKIIPPYAQIVTKRQLTPADRGFYVFTLLAESSPPGNRAETKIEVTVSEKSLKPKRLADRRYVANVPWNVTLGTRIVDVKKRSVDDLDLTYRLDPYSSTIPFDVDPFTGEVFTTDVLDEEKYIFDVVGVSNNNFLASGVDRYRSEVKVLVDLNGSSLRKNASFSSSSQSSSSADCDDVSNNFKCDTTSRYKRALRPEISMSLYENHRLNEILPEKISLSNNERIKDAPIEKEYLTVYANGTMILTRHLNYETLNPVSSTIFVQNTMTMRKKFAYFLFL